MDHFLHRKFVDASGRIIIRETDDRGERFPIIQSGPAQCSGIEDFTEVFRTESMERARRGHITFTVDLRTNEAFGLTSLLLEVNVVGYVGGASQVLQYVTMDANALGEFEWEDPESYSAIAMEVRQNLDGVNDDSVVGIDYLRLNVAGAYWR